MQIEYANRIWRALNANVGKECIAVSNLAEEPVRHEVDKEPRAEREKRPIIGIRYLTMRFDRMFRKYDDENMFDMISGKSFYVGAKGDVVGKHLKSREKCFWHFLETKDIEVGVLNKLECTIEFAVAVQHVPGIDFHLFVFMPDAMRQILL